MIKQIASLAVTGRCFSTERVLNFFPKADVRLSLVYGANGSGKSTISRAFQVLTQEADSDISARALDAEGNEIALASPAISVFNEEYIDANVKIDDDGLGSIVLLGEQVEEERRKLETQRTARDPYFILSNSMSPEYHWERIRSILKGSSRWAKVDSEIKVSQY